MLNKRDNKLAFIIAVSYLVSFVFIRVMVLITGSVNSSAAQAVKEGAKSSYFYIGRNVILFGYHVHHFYFGILFICVAGWLAIVGTTHLRKEAVAVLFGVGLGLLMDEIGLLLTWGNYFSSLSYLLGVLLLGIFLNLIYFPKFWGKMRETAVNSSLSKYLGQTTTDVLVNSLDGTRELLLRARKYHLITLTFSLLLGAALAALVYLLL
ncbi:hypothetical protein KGY64_06665, partial [Candidatus Bipolaricaulota bacterium]|nr:hypothetical protein [Candidatus Bipolaricaulota bacterium]